MTKTSHLVTRLTPVPECYKKSGYSLIELLVVIAVLGILSSLAISYVSGVARESRIVVARQQQAELQSALEAWIIANSSTNGLAATQDEYENNASQADRLGLVLPYLRDQYLFTPGSDGISSDALGKLGKTLQFSDWVDLDYPKVLMAP